MSTRRRRTARATGSEGGPASRPQGVSQGAPPPVDASRLRLARVVLVASGLMALVAAFVVPLLNAAAFYRVVARPAFELSPSLEAADLDTLSAEQQQVLEALAVPRLWNLVGEPIPDHAADDEVAVTLTGVEVWALAGRLDVAAEQAGELRGETELIARFLQIAVLSLFLVGLLCVALPLIPRLGVESTWTIVITGSAALLLLSTHLLSLSVDLVGVGSEALFAWPSHAVALALVFGVGLGSMLPMGLHNALRAVIGTMALTTATMLAAAVYVAL